MKADLYSGSDDDAHEEVWDDAGDHHHQALNDRNARVEAQDKEQVVFEAGMEPDHVVADSSGDEGDHYEVRHGGERVADHEWGDPVVPVKPLPLKNLRNFSQSRLSFRLTQEEVSEKTRRIAAIQCKKRHQRPETRFRLFVYLHVFHERREPADRHERHEPENERCTGSSCLSQHKPRQLVQWKKKEKEQQTHEQAGD